MSLKIGIMNKLDQPITVLFTGEEKRILEELALETERSVGYWIRKWTRIAMEEAARERDRERKHKRHAGT